MTTTVTVDGRTVHLSPSATTALTQARAHEQRPDTVAVAVPHPATRAALTGHGLVTVHPDGHILLTEVGRVVALTLEAAS